jgi:hypothetical protein
VLIALSVYFLASFHFVMHSPPRWATWGTFGMFTKTGNMASTHKARVRRDGVWRELDLQEVFPFRWETGHRFHAQTSPKGLLVVAGSACRRMEPMPEAIELTVVRWTLTPYRSKSRWRTEDKPPVVFQCGTPVPLPDGRTL